MTEFCFLPLIASQKILSSCACLLKKSGEALKIEQKTERAFFYENLAKAQLSVVSLWLCLDGKKKPILSQNRRIV